MCFDESTDVNNNTTPVVILRYAVGDTMKEELVILLSLHERILDIDNSVMKTFLTQNLGDGRIALKITEK